ncbi:MAG: hypothetical protein JWO67_2568 [Streptosporangiaceae bacterium]|nr:hypothetical protein [Streptosporangiaceae bacterium]
MALPTSEQDWVTYLAQIHDQEVRELKALNDEYELKSVKAYMHPEIFREIGDRLQQVVIAWPMMVVDSLEERLDVEGFRLPSAGSADDDLWRVWQENSADEESQLAHVDALTMKRAYIAIGTNEDDADTPRMTFESPLEVYGDIDPRTRRVRAALRRYSSYGGSYAREQEHYATLYLPNQTVFYERTGVAGQYNEIDRDQHNLGLPPIVPMVNRARLADWRGRSELDPILPLAHAANKIATDMMVAAEFVALPLRGIMGLGPEDLEDAGGNKMTALQALLGRLLLVPNADENTKMFEFTSANLSNFHQTIDALAKLVSSIAALPPHYLGFTTDNPASADAIRSNEIRLVKRAERKQRAFGGAHEQAMRIVRRLQEGDWDPKLRRLETIWRDASTPTVAQVADASVKKHAEGIISTRQAQEDSGYTDAQIKRMNGEMAAQRAQLFKLPTAADQVPPTKPAVTGGDVNPAAA